NRLNRLHRLWRWPIGWNAIEFAEPFTQRPSVVVRFTTPSQEQDDNRCHTNSTEGSPPPRPKCALRSWISGVGTSIRVDHAMRAAELLSPNSTNRTKSSVQRQSGKTKPFGLVLRSRTQQPPGMGR